jgi:nucleotide-binding universal stress UspA family protein
VIASVIHPTDLTAASDLAFSHALRIALAAGARLTVVHVDRGALHTEGDDLPKVRERLARWRGQTAHAAGTEGPRGFQVRKVNFVGGDPVEAIVAELERTAADLIVLATHRREGLTRFLHRDVGTPVARRTHAMTLFVPEHVPGFVTTDEGWVSLRRILVPIDHVPRPQAAIEAAAEIARLFGEKTTFDLLHVGTAGSRPAVEPPDDPRWTWERELRGPPVVEALLGSARKRRADLIVVATHGRAGVLDALRGSTTERILRSAPCPVLAVPTA